MATFDYIVGELKCLKCGKVSEADESTGMQVKFMQQRDMKPYRIGDHIEFDEDICGWGFVLVHPQTDKYSFKFILDWGCCYCTLVNAVLIEVENSIITKMESIKLTPEIIDQVNYVTEDIDYFGWKIVNDVLIPPNDEP